MSDTRARLVVVMGVSGSGKSTVGSLVADALGVPFVDGDDFHDRASIEKMRKGIPLDDAARGPWLDRLHEVLTGPRATGAILASSALTVAYRDRLAGDLAVRFVLLDVPAAVLEDRLRRRHGHFAGAALLASQLATLERGPDIVAVDADQPAPVVAAAVVVAVASPAPRVGTDGEARSGGHSMIGVLVLLPLLALAAAAVLAMVSVKRSTLQITADGVEYRNYPQATQTVPLARVRRFEETVAVGNFSGLRPATAVLVLTDGSRLPVRSMSAPDAGVGVDALNARVAALRGRD